jgi:flagellar motor switch protein FliN/FliY
MSPEQTSDTNLTQDQIDIIGEVSNISMGSAATALSNIMGKKVTITSPQVQVGSRAAIEQVEKVPSVGVIISYTEGILGKDILLIRQKDAVEIAKVLMGEEMATAEFGELQISGIAEVMNQMMGASATALSNFIGETVNISPPTAFMLTEENKNENLGFLYDQINEIIMVRFLFEVEDTIKSDIYMIMSHDFSIQLVNAMLKTMGMETPASQQPPVPQQPVLEQQPAVPQQPAASRPAGSAVGMTPGLAAVAAQAAAERAAAEQMAAQQAAAARAAVIAPAPATTVRPVTLGSFDQEPPLTSAEASNFDLIQDVPLELSVEVGKATKLVREIIDLSVGAIIELDKQAGDPVDVIVNGQLIAHGEVVVIDENFGVRITEIIGKN